MDLRFKKDLIINQLAAKELYIAKFFIETQKWIPAINRLKNIVENYQRTVFIEEALYDYRNSLLSRFNRRSKKICKYSWL